jgi:hypothetical protein
MKWGRLVVLLGVMTLWPSAAYASFWAWLEELSGPGPFHGWVVATPVLCTSDGELVSCRARSDSHRPKRLLVLSVGKLGSGDNPRFNDEPKTPDRREVKVLQTSVTYMYRLHPTVDVGFGAGTLRFSGDAFDPLWRFTLVPTSVSVRPLALVKEWKYKWWAYVVRGEVETSFVTKGYNALDFGNSTSTFSSGPEFLTRAAIVLDFTPAVWR